MGVNGVSSLITQNRLISQAKSRSRSQSASIGSILNSGSNGKNSLADAIKKQSSNINGLSAADAKSKEHYTTMKKAAESVQSCVKNLLLLPDKEWDKMTEEEITEYRENALSGVNNFVNDYNVMVKSMAEEGGKVNQVYLGQLESYYKNGKADLEELGITMKDDGTLSVNQELLRAADIQKIKKALGSSGSFVDDVGKRAKDISANAETNLAVLNKSQYAGTYTYDKYGSDIFDLLTGGSYSTKG
ncbi:MAG: hypothetical protein NC400_03210 [Clostridium sp.]|nr:hypothetical protein [Clostridium sp.]